MPYKHSSSFKKFLEILVHKNSGLQIYIWEVNLQWYEDRNGDDEDDCDAGNETLAGLHRNQDTGAGGGEVKHVSGGAGRDGVEGTVALATVGVPGLLWCYASRPSLGVVTIAPANIHKRH